MRGIEAAASGRLGRDPEQRTTKAGNVMAVLNIAVDGDDETPTWLKALCFGERAETAMALTKGDRAYVEGSLKLEQWTSQSGEARSGLTLMAWTVQPMGAIGKRRPRKAKAEDPDDDYGSARPAPARQAPADYLDDEIPF